MKNLLNIWVKDEIKMKKEFTIVIEQDEDGIYVASVPELEGCHTQAKTLEELQERIKEAIQLYLEVESELVEEIPLALWVFRRLKWLSKWIFEIGSLVFYGDLWSAIKGYITTLPFIKS